MKTLCAVMTFALMMTTVSTADILWNAKTPVEIGRGTTSGTTIRWTNCKGENPKNYDAPPYRVDSADNCTVGAPAFGLECTGSTNQPVQCRVVDVQKIRPYFPTANNNDVVTFTIGPNVVELQRAGSIIRLRY